MDDDTKELIISVVFFFAVNITVLGCLGASMYFFDRPMLNQLASEVNKTNTYEIPDCIKNLPRYPSGRPIDIRIAWNELMSLFDPYFKNKDLTDWYNEMNNFDIFDMNIIDYFKKIDKISWIKENAKLPKFKLLDIYGDINSLAACVERIRIQFTPESYNKQTLNAYFNKNEDDDDTDKDPLEIELDSTDSVDLPFLIDQVASLYCNIKDLVYTYKDNVWLKQVTLENCYKPNEILDSYFNEISGMYYALLTVCPLIMSLKLLDMAIFHNIPNYYELFRLNYPNSLFAGVNNCSINHVVLHMLNVSGVGPNQTPYRETFDYFAYKNDLVHRRLSKGEITAILYNELVAMNQKDFGRTPGLLDWNFDKEDEEDYSTQFVNSKFLNDEEMTFGYQFDAPLEERTIEFIRNKENLVDLLIHSPGGYISPEARFEMLAACAEEHGLGSHQVEDLLKEMKMFMETTTWSPRDTQEEIVFKLKIKVPESTTDAQFDVIIDKMQRCFDDYWLEVWDEEQKADALIEKRNLNFKEDKNAPDKNFNYKKMSNYWTDNIDANVITGPARDVIINRMDSTTRMSLRQAFELEIFQSLGDRNTGEAIKEKILEALENRQEFLDKNLMDFIDADPLCVALKNANVAFGSKPMWFGLDSKNGFEYLFNAVYHGDDYALSQLKKDEFAPHVVLVDHNVDPSSVVVEPTIEKDTKKERLAKYKFEPKKEVPIEILFDEPEEIQKNLLSLEPIPIPTEIIVTSNETITTAETTTESEQTNKITKKTNQKNLNKTDTSKFKFEYFSDLIQLVETIDISKLEPPQQQGQGQVSGVNTTTNSNTIIKTDEIKPRFMFQTYMSTQTPPIGNPIAGVETSLSAPEIINTTNLTEDALISVSNTEEHLLIEQTTEQASTTTSTTNTEQAIEQTSTTNTEQATEQAIEQTIEQTSTTNTEQAIETNTIIKTDEIKPRFMFQTWLASQPPLPQPVISKGCPPPI